MASNGPDAAVILAGGAGSRLGGVPKPALPVAGRPMLQRVLTAVAAAPVRVVVGPPELHLPAGVSRAQEQPPGGGPAAGAAAGLAALPPDCRYTALLAADLPLLTASAIRQLWRAATGAKSVAGAVYVDGTGRPQWLCGVWQVATLRGRRTELPADLAGVPLHRLLTGLPVATVTAEAGPPPWWDCDTEPDWQAAEEWANGDPE